LLLVLVACGLFSATGSIETPCRDFKRPATSTSYSRVRLEGPLLDDEASG
jgi:hypothetical protein